MIPSPNTIAKICAARWNSAARRIGQKHGLSESAVREIWASHPELIPPRIKAVAQPRAASCPRAAEFGIVPYSLQMADGVTVSLARVRSLEEARHGQ